MRLHIRVDDVGVEVISEVEDEMVDVKLLSDTASVVDIGDRAAASVGVSAPQFHRDADDLVTLLLQQQRCDGGVDPTAHCTHHLHAKQARGS